MLITSIFDPGSFTNSRSCTTQTPPTAKCKLQMRTRGNYRCGYRTCASTTHTPTANGAWVVQHLLLLDNIGGFIKMFKYLISHEQKCQLTVWRIVENGKQVDGEDDKIPERQRVEPVSQLIFLQLDHKNTTVLIKRLGSILVGCHRKPFHRMPVLYDS